VAAIATSERSVCVADPPAAARSAPRLFAPGEVSLEESILRTWEDLTGSGSAECPVCGGRMHLARGCESCGSALS
jgi:hypothetical protein